MPDFQHKKPQPPPQSAPGPGTTPFVQPAAAAGTAAGGSSSSFVIGALAVFAVGVVTVGSLGACLLAGVAWYAMTPSGPIDPAAEPLIAQLQSEDVTARAQAADSLAGMGSGARNAVPELKKLLDDQDDSVRFAAAKALANITGWSQSVKREVSRRFVGRTERSFGNRTQWEDEWEIQYKIETVGPGS